MTPKPREIVVQTVAVAGGEITGQLRLQKIIYLLEQCSGQSPFDFSYYHYGPYSRDLDQAIDAAKALNGLQELTQRRVSDGAPYSVFRVHDGSVPDTLFGLPAERSRSLIQHMKTVSSTVIELAATIHWLVVVEKVPDWRTELRRRKGAKTEHGRTEDALRLLREIGLDEHIPAMA